MGRIGRRGFLGSMAAASAVPWLGCAEPRGRRPDVVMITVDQLRSFDRLPSSLALPALDGLRARSVSFTNHTIASAPCTPARATLYTGRHAPTVGLVDNINFPFVPDLDPAVPTLGTYLAAAGYATAYQGKWHLSAFDAANCSDPGARLSAYGFAHYGSCDDLHGIPYTGFLNDPDVAEGASRWLTETGTTLRRERTPFFLAVNFVNPHDVMFLDVDGNGTTQVSGGVPVFGVPGVEPYLTAHGAPLPSTLTQGFDERPAAHAEMAALLRDVFGDVPTDRDDLWDAFQDAYWNCIRDVDRHIGTVLDTLAQTGLGDGTIVIFVADHGELAGAHGLRQKGPCFYRENVNVPFTIAHPDVRAPREVTGVSSSVDLVPTVLGMLGLDPRVVGSSTVLAPGLDLSSSVASGTSTARTGVGALFAYDAPDMLDAAFAAANAPIWVNDMTACPVGLPDLGKRGFLRGVFDGRYRFARYFAPNDYHRPADLAELFARNDVELYDTATDPDEATNLAAPARRDANAALLETMRAALEAAIDRELGTDTPPTPTLECVR